MQQCAFRRFFLGTALAFGLLYALLVPPFQSPDETAHFYRAAHLASGHPMGIVTADMRLGGYLPKSLQQIYEPFAQLRYDYKAKALLHHFRKSWEQPLNPSDTAFVDFPNVGYYAPFPYLAQGLVLRALMALNCRPLVLFYTGRLTTLAIWMALIMAALRLLPMLAPTMAWLALLPSSLFLHASLSGDAVTNGLCFWLLAALLSLIFDESQQQVGKQRGLLVGIFICSAMIVLSKPVYFPLVLLAWLVPKGKFQQNRGYIAFAGGLLLLNLTLLAWWYQYAGNLFIPYGAYNPLYREGVQLNEGVWPHEQLDFVLRHPFGFTKTAILSYAESAPATMAHYFGKFGWEKNYLPGWLIGLLCLGTIWVSLTDIRSAAKLKPRHRIAFSVVALLMMGALALVLYMQWMPVGSDRILALSGRYFFAVFPLLFFAISGFFASQNGGWTGWTSKLLLIISLAWGAWEVLLRYYL